MYDENKIQLKNLLSNIAIGSLKYSRISHMADFILHGKEQTLCKTHLVFGTTRGYVNMSRILISVGEQACKCPC